MSNKSAVSVFKKVFADATPSLEEGKCDVCGATHVQVLTDGDVSICEACTEIASALKGPTWTQSGQWAALALAVAHGHSWAHFVKGPLDLPQAVWAHRKGVAESLSVDPRARVDGVGPSTHYETGGRRARWEITATGAVLTAQRKQGDTLRVTLTPRGFTYEKLKAPICARHWEYAHAVLFEIYPNDSKKLDELKRLQLIAYGNELVLPKTQEEIIQYSSSPFEEESPRESAPFKFAEMAAKAAIKDRNSRGRSAEPIRLALADIEQRAIQLADERRRRMMEPVESI